MPVQPPRSGDLVYKTENEVLPQTSGQVTTPSGATVVIDVKPRPGKTEVDKGVCMGMSLRWIRKAMLHQSIELVEIVSRRHLGKQAEQGYAKAARAQGIYESIKSPSDQSKDRYAADIEHVCAYYQLRVLKLQPDEWFEEACFRLVLNPSRKHDSGEEAYCLLTNYNHAMAFKMSIGGEKSYFFDPNCGLYAYRTRLELYNAINAHLDQEDYRGGMGILIAKLALAPGVSLKRLPSQEQLAPALGHARAAGAEAAKDKKGCCLIL